MSSEEKRTITSPVCSRHLCSVVPQSGLLNSGPAVLAGFLRALRSRSSHSTDFDISETASPVIWFGIVPHLTACYDHIRASTKGQLMDGPDARKSHASLSDSQSAAAE